MLYTSLGCPGEMLHREAMYGSALSRIALRRIQFELRSTARRETRSTFRWRAPESSSSIAT